MQLIVTEPEWVLKYNTFITTENCKKKKPFIYKTWSDCGIHTLNGIFLWGVPEIILTFEYRILLAGIFLLS